MPDDHTMSIAVEISISLLPSAIPRIEIAAFPLCLEPADGREGD